MKKNKIFNRVNKSNYSNEIVDNNIISSKKSRKLYLSMIFPNLVTVIALCLGLSAIRYAFHLKFQESIILILIAAILDGIDGRLARFLNSTSEFGAQLDSLADFANFGIVPGFVLYFWINSFYDVKVIDWGLSLFFAVCCALRLARFNSQLNVKSKNPNLDKYFFQGVPAPMGAMLAVFPMIIYFEFDAGFYSQPQNVVAYAAMIAILMASRIPTISIKKIPINNDFFFITFIIICLLVICAIVETWLTLVFVGFVYLLSIPLTIFLFLKFYNSK